MFSDSFFWSERNYHRKWLPNEALVFVETLDLFRIRISLLKLNFGDVLGFRFDEHMVGYFKEIIKRKSEREKEEKN